MDNLTLIITAHDVDYQVNLGDCTQTDYSDLIDHIDDILSVFTHYSSARLNGIKLANSDLGLSVLNALAKIDI